MNIKKIVLPILIFALSVHLICYGADIGVSNNDDIFEMAEHHNALRFLEQLNILSGLESKKPNDTVSRAEFTALSVRCLNVACTNEGGAFEDVTKGTPFADEINTAHSLNLIGGISQAEFAPDSAISTEQAIKISVCALGYESLAIVKGGYPYGYMQVANSSKLLLGIDTSNSFLLWKDAVLLIFNTLNADIITASGIIDNDIIYKQTPGACLLNKNFKLEKISGIVESVGAVSLRSDYVYSSEQITVNSITMKNLMEDAEYLLGKYSDVWYDKELGTAVCAYVHTFNTQVTLDASSTEEKNNIITNYLSGEEKAYKLDDSFIFVKNGRLTRSEEIVFSDDNGELTLIDNNGDSKYDVCLAEYGETAIIQSIDRLSKKLFFANALSSGKRFITLADDNNCYYDIKLYDNDATSSIDFEDLKTAMVATIYASSDETYFKIAASGKTIKGSMEEKTDSACKIKGNEYQLTSYFKENFSLAVLGTTYTFLLDHNDKIVAVSSSDSSNIKYGYLIGAYTKSGIEQTVMLKLLTENNQKVICTLSDKIVLNGETVFSNDDKVTKAIKNGNYPRYQIIRYKEANNEIVMIDTAENAPSGYDTNGNKITLDDKYNSEKAQNDSLTKFVDKKNVWIRSGGQAFPYFVFGSTTKLFAVPRTLLTNPNQNFDDELFRITTFNWSIDTKNKTVDAYDYDENFYPRIVVAYTMASGVGAESLETPSAHKAPEIVEKVTDVVIEDGEKTKCIYTYDGATFRQYYINPSLTDDFIQADLIPLPGDIIRPNTDIDGYLNGIEFDVRFDSSLKKPVYSTNMASSNFANALSYIIGDVYRHTEKSISIYSANAPAVTNVTGPDDDLYTFRLSSAINYIIFDCETLSARPAKYTDIMSIKTSGEGNASLAVINLHYGEPNCVFIYK